MQRHGGEGRTIYAAITPVGRAALDAAAPRHSQEVRHLILDRLTAHQIDHSPTTSARFPAASTGPQSNILIWRSGVTYGRRTRATASR